MRVVVELSETRASRGDRADGRRGDLDDAATVAVHELVGLGPVNHYTESYVA